MNRSELRKIKNAVDAELSEHGNLPYVLASSYHGQQFKDARKDSE
jgi:hypothetical protein